MSACHPTARRVNAELDAGRAQDKASNAAVALKGLEQQLEALRAEAAELREGAWVGGWVGACFWRSWLAGPTVWGHLGWCELAAWAGTAARRHGCGWAG